MRVLGYFVVLIISLCLVACDGDGGEEGSPSTSPGGSSGSSSGGSSGSGSGGSGDDGNGTQSTADPLFVLGLELSGSGVSGGASGVITGLSDIDWYYFDVTRSGVLVLETTDTPNLDPYCELHRASSFVDANHDSGNGDNCRIEVLISVSDVPARYYVRISGTANGSGTRNYTIHYDWTPDSSDGSNGGCSGNDCPEGATFISGSSNGDATGSINPQGDVDWWYFLPQIAGNVIVYTLGDTDTVCETYDKSLVLQSSDDDDGEARNCEISREQGDSGDYGVIGDRIYIKVRGFGNSTGDYQLFWEINP